MTTASDASGDHPRLSGPALVAFSLPGLCLGALAVSLTVYLTHFYASHFRLGLQAVGLTFMAVRLIDMLFDPVIGVMMDRTRTVFGRYRVWLAAGVPLLMAPVYMLFMPPRDVGFFYLLGWLFLYYIGLSVITLAHAAWASVIAARYHERSRVFGVLQIVASLGAVLVLILPVLLARQLKSSGVGNVAIMGAFVLVATPVGVALALMRTPERIVGDRKNEHVTLADYWEMISRPDMRRIILADLCLALGPGWMSALYLFYFHDARGFSIDQANILLVIYIGAGLVGAGAVSWLATRIGKHRALMVASTGYSLGLLGLALLPKGAFAPAAGLMFVLGCLAVSFTLLDRAMVADVGDAVRLEQGKHRVGLLYAMITTTQKIAAAGSIGLSFVALSLFNYRPEEGAVNTPAAIHGLELVYLITPVVFVMLGGACYFGYRLDSRRHGEIRAALDARDAQLVEPA